MDFVFFKSSNSEPKFYVIGSQFECKTTTEELKILLDNFLEDSENLKRRGWFHFWSTEGLQILNRVWEIKYLEKQTEDLTVRQELWKTHVMETCHDQWLIYQKVYYNYQCSVKNSFLNEIVVKTRDKDFKFCVTDDEVLKEIEQLKLLGLPTKFGKHQVTAAHNNKNRRSLSPVIQLLADTYSNTSSETDEGNDNNDNTDDDMSSITDKTLHELHLTTSKKKKKKKKKKHILHQLPAFMRNEPIMIKYWRRRFSLFSKFDEGILLDRESWFSVTPEKVAHHLAERLACDVIVDGFCGCGGNSIQFAKYCKKVIAIDIDISKLSMAKHNATIYGVANKIEFILGDFLQLAKYGQFQADCVFLSPPWGGPMYKNKVNYNIEKYLQPTGASELLALARNINENVALFLPRNSNIPQIVKLSGAGNKCEVEHNFLDSRLIAITALYGDRIINSKSEHVEQNKTKN